MKPYFKVLYNKIRFSLKNIFCCKNLIVEGISLIGYNLRFKIKPSSEILISDRVSSDGRLVIIVDENASLFIGSKTYFNEDVMISCKNSIKIGNGCQFGPNVKIFDNNHKFDAANGVNNTHSTEKIEIGNNVWLGANVVVLKGTKIGNNCVIGAGCVISGEIPESSIVTQSRELKIESMRK